MSLAPFPAFSLYPIQLKFGAHKYTVYIITFDRDEMLKRVVTEYAKSALVDKIIVSWNNLDRKVGLGGWLRDQF